MISVVHNEIQKAIQIDLDEKGVELLMKTLQWLKRGETDHCHIYATNDDNGLSMDPPYRDNVVFGELILNLLPSEAWE